jgi:NAD(P)-dependent dehydrogenase (short-subunit alcohol dehydrogenase family)
MEPNADRDSKHALIIGASRGLGLGLAREYLRRGWHVVASVRNNAGREALQSLPAAVEGKLSVPTLDVNCREDIDSLRRDLKEQPLDLLLINAGVAGDPTVPAEEVSAYDFAEVMLTNALAPVRLTAAFNSHVKSGGVIAAMSSNMRSVSSNSGDGWEVYRASTAALNQLMKSFAARHEGDCRTYLLVSPGWVRTDMGGSNAPLDVETSAAGIADTIATFQGAGGVHFVDYRCRAIPW